jgi:hypothetical protein
MLFRLPERGFSVKRKLTIKKGMSNAVVSLDKPSMQEIKNYADILENNDDREGAL